MSCVDIVAILQPDGSIRCSPVIVRFSKPAFSKQNVAILIDGEPVRNKSGVQFVLDKGAQYCHFENLNNFVRKSSNGSLNGTSTNGNHSPPSDNSIKSTAFYYKRDTKEDIKAVVESVVFEKNDD